MRTNIERERKFLVTATLLPEAVFAKLEFGDVKNITTGYFTKDGAAVRVSVRDLGTSLEKSKFCIKSPGGQEEREEFEYTIPTSDALRMLELSPTLLSKKRIDLDGWEIDCITINLSDEPGSPVYTEMWIAEWEETPNKKPFPTERPDWIGAEVTDDVSYSNQALAWKYGRREFERRRLGVIKS